MRYVRPSYGLTPLFLGLLVKASRFAAEGDNSELPGPSSLENWWPSL